ncbi:MAG: hypothetical protein GC203_15710 [Phenylobacterium sp.]|uniref:winged helix-turn-helix domain-containing protein n=1 Tax=Phenylobacterium sp. TaxID=1871053 RepID=UPI0025D6B61F|nr:winged helix-turn-helix domain-containing protein [Phenylobacterium sp.]MBI1199307.1 hypothetical protein [Phenylobacterium sp.]
MDERREEISPGRRQIAGFRVGAFEAEPQRNELRLDGERHPVEPLVMDVLCYLADRAGEIATRDELIDHVWFFNPAADESLTRAISLLRRVFARDAAGGPYIQTVWTRGYVLVAEVHRQGAAPAVRTFAGTPELETGYSVGVLGFHSNSPAPDDAFLADGITRDLTMLLSRVPRLRVAAYSSAARVDERTMGLDEISARLGARYLVSGSISRQGSDFQVRAALMDAMDDAQVWAQRIDAPLEEFFAVQDRLILDISTSIISALQVSLSAAMRGRRPFQLGAYELVQRAEALRLNYNRQTALEIVSLLDQALEIDPADAAVHAALAVQHTQNIVSNFAGSAAETFPLAKRHVETALGLAPRDPDVLAAAGIAAAMMGNARLAVRHLEQAADLDPNNPHTLAVLGWQQCWVEGTPTGRELIETAERRAPHHPRFALWAHYRGHCEIRLGDPEAAIAAYRDCVERNPNYSLNLVTLAAALAFVGEAAEARRVIATVREIAPRYHSDDYERLARRMVYWFGPDPSRDAMIGALRSAWSEA